MGPKLKTRMLPAGRFGLPTLWESLLALPLLSHSRLLKIAPMQALALLFLRCLLARIGLMGLVVCLDILRRWLSENWSATGRAHLLPLKPAPQTAEMQYVTTGELLRPLAFIHASTCRRFLGTRLDPGSHLLSTNDAGILSFKLLCCGVRIAGVHVAGCISILNEVVDAFDERAQGHKKISHDVDRNAVECHENDEEAQIDNRLDEIRG